MSKASIVTSLILATLALHKFPCKSPDKAVISYCRPGLADTKTGDGDVIDSFWQNNSTHDLVLTILVPRRGHNYSIMAKAVRGSYAEYLFNEEEVSWYRINVNVIQTFLELN